MKTSAIRHPERDYFVIRRSWQLKALEIEQTGPKRGNAVECGAEILSIMEFHYNNRQANRKYREFVERAIRSAGKNQLPPLGDWMPYSIKYIEELTLWSRSQNVILQALDIMEAKGFISTDVPADVVEAYGLSTKWYRLNVDAINEWIESNIPKTWMDAPEPEKKKGGRPRKTKSEEKQEATDTITKQVEILGTFYQHIHGKNSNFVLDQDRRNRIAARLKEERTIGQCAQAIIGNALSDFHQARHPENKLGVVNERTGHPGKIYDDIDHIFGEPKKSKRFEQSIGYAEDAGVTEDIAFSELQAFIGGQPSRYIKSRPKMPQNKRKQQESAPVKVPENAKQYREFAFSVAAFFVTDVPAKEIVELAKTQDGLAEKSKGITNAAYLAECIREKTRVFRSELTEAMESQLVEFTTTFCDLQRLNSDE